MSVWTDLPRWRTDRHISRHSILTQVSSYFSFLLVLVVLESTLVLLILSFFMTVIGYVFPLP